MRYLYQLLAAVGLALVLIPAILHYTDALAINQMKTYIFVGSALWFAGAIPWLGKKKRQA